MPDEGIPVIKMETSESFWRSPWFHWVILPAVAAVAATGITSVSATTTTGGALFARAGLVDGQLATAQFAPVELMNGFLGFCIQGHIHKAKATRLAGELVLEKIDIRNLAIRGEQATDFIFAGIERDISYIDIH